MPGPKLPTALATMKTKTERAVKADRIVKWTADDRKRCMESLGRYLSENSPDDYTRWRALGLTGADDTMRNNWMHAVQQDPVGGMSHGS